MTEPSARPHVPFRINLDQQRKRAKDLLAAHRAGVPEAIERFRARHPKGALPEAATLADAHLVIARELGETSWPRLKAHVQAMERARGAMAAGTAPDADVPTLHIRCGSDIQTTLRAAGFAGDFLEVSDPVCQGPVPAGPDLDATRVRFLVDAYGAEAGMSEAAVAGKLARERAGLATAGRYGRAVIWCEHDSYDQLMLARCLAAFAEGGAPEVIDLVSINRFPGAARFIGLGQLPPEALRLLWPTRRRVGAAQLALGRRVWSDLRRADPRPLAAVAGQEAPGLPDLPRALRRHLRELPGTKDGLSLTQRLILEVVAEEAPTVGEAFARLMREREPLPWLGDIMFLAIVMDMAAAGRPPMVLADDAGRVAWPQRRMSLTQVGRGILDGGIDFLDCAPRERWVGGVHITAAPAWRWDEEQGRPVHG